MKYFLLLVSLLFNSVSLAEENYQFTDAAQRQLFFDLTNELRCPKCQNQNIADSDAMIAIDLRRKVYELLQQGYQREEVVEYMRERYGDFVSYQPPLTPATLWLWMLPLFFVIGGLVVVYQHRQKSQLEVDQQRLAEADKLLEKD